MWAREQEKGRANEKNSGKQRGAFSLRFQMGCPSSKPVSDQVPELKAQ